MIDLNTVLFGTDAEVFLRTLSGTPIPVCGMVGGTKDKPRQLDGLPEGFCVQEDNAALEFNVPPNHSHSKVVNSVMVALENITKLLPKSVKLDPMVAAVDFDEGYLKIPAMGVFGCEPDFNAWTLTTNDAPRPPRPGFRSAAAHIHLGWKDPTDEDRIELIRMCDVFVTLPNLGHENATDRERRKLYGKAGAFRWKEYGVEHRVLSNAWLRDPYFMKNTLKLYTDALHAMSVGVTVDKKDYGAIQDAINNGKTDTASSIYLSYNNKWAKARGENFNPKALYASFA